MKGVIRGLEVQERDVRVLYDLACFRGVTVDHLAALHFEGRRPAAVRRIGILKRAGLVASMRHGQQHVHHLTRAGYEVLAQYHEPPASWEAIRRRHSGSPLMLQHEQLIVEAKVAFAQAASASSAVLQRFDPLVVQRQQKLVPDAAITLQSNREQSHFLLEVDRSTEPLATIQEKARRYRRWRETKFFPSADGSALPYRVLFVCCTERRRDSLTASLLELHPPVLTLVWLATRDAVAANPLGPVWLTPQALREAHNRHGNPILQPLIPHLQRKKKSSQ
jgi:hypothetical protein